MTANHYHVVGMCRNCSQQQTHAIAKTLDNAEEGIRKIPEQFDKHPEKVEGATMRRIDANVYRLVWGEHDIIITSTQCEDDYQDCYSGFAHFLMERRVRDAIVGKLSQNKQAQQEKTKQRLSQILQDFSDQDFGLAN